jgi:deazaflavin-dependent oxidoreductase (nitroreductase family)
LIRRRDRDLSSVSADTLNGIPKVDLEKRPLWKRNLNWLLGGQLWATKTGLAIWRRFAAPLEPPIMKATGGRVRLNVAVPIVVLSSTGARSGQRREIPLAYFTDDADVILIASNYGHKRRPAWYHNLVAHPECELHIGNRGGRFVARETTGPDRDRLYGLARERLNRVWDVEEKRSADFRTIPVMRLTPE